MKLDTVEAERAEGYSVMQAWQGDPTVSIDRFDARYQNWDSCANFSLNQISEPYLSIK